MTMSGWQRRSLLSSVFSWLAPALAPDQAITAAKFALSTARKSSYDLSGVFYPEGLPLTLR
jgi:hypothetical protein